MSKTHYETLGIPKGSSAAEVRSAYRKLVLKHHPDRSENKSSEKFLQITAAYEVLGDPGRRKAYDATLELEAERNRIRGPHNSAARKAPTAVRTTTQAKRPQEETEGAVARLSLLMAMNRYVEADELARSLLRSNPKNAAALAILGDIARARGRSEVAINYFARAVQADPTNPIYQRRHDELAMGGQQHLGQTSARSGTGGLLISASVCAAACLYLGLAKEPAGFHFLAPISTWGAGAAIMLFISGVAIGAGLSTSRQIDRLSAVSFTSLGKASPIVGLGALAVVNFWVAAFVYVVVALVQNVFSYSISRLMAAIAVSVAMLSFAACFSAILNPWQILLWGGNLSFIGAICGWTVADSFRA